MERVPLIPGEVEVLFADPAGFDPDELARNLDERERARADRLRFGRDRRLYIVAHGLLRAALEEYTGTRADRIRLVRDERGRPRCEDSEVRFSLSHTPGQVALAFARGREVGVDVQETTRGVRALKIARRFFAPEETAEIRSLEGADRRDRFFDLWTRKEALWKATGEGLAGNLGKRVSEIEGVRIWTFRPTPAHRAAVAVLTKTPRCCCQVDKHT